MKSKVSPLNLKIREYFRANQDLLDHNFAETGKLFNVSADVARHQARAVRQELLNATNPEPIIADPIEEKEFSITEEVLTRKENAHIKSLKKQLENVINEYYQLSNMYDVALALRAQDINREIPKINANPKSDGEATAIISISDGHFGKTILKSTVNGINEYTPAIARKRMDTLAENTIKLIEKERNAIRIDNLLLDFGGDFIDNSELHEGGQMATLMSPMEETLFSRELLAKYLRTIQEYGKFKKITVSCVRGNHPRITKKMSAAVDYRMNYETILYSILKSDFSTSLFDWYIPDSDIAEVEVYGRLIRNIHGHQVRYGGGIGGLTIPLNKYILRQDQIRPAYHTLLHHFHNYSSPTSHSTLNGSICGMDPYAFSLGCEFQRPVQSFMLLDKKKGITIKAPIFCD
jgi:hypothetical protein